jgi:hypothetical protein
VYSCTAQNTAGSVSANATLTVLGKRAAWNNWFKSVCMLTQRLSVPNIGGETKIPKVLPFPRKNKRLFGGFEVSEHIAPLSMWLRRWVCPSALRKGESKNYNTFSCVGITFLYSAHCAILTVFNTIKNIKENTCIRAQHSRGWL